MPTNNSIKRDIFSRTLYIPVYRFKFCVLYHVRVVFCLQYGINVVKSIYLRWIERIDGMKRFIQSYNETFKALEGIKDGKIFNGVGWDAKSKVKANGMWSKMKDFKFIVALVITNEILSYFRPITKNLQGLKGEILKFLYSVST